MFVIFVLLVAVVLPASSVEAHDGIKGVGDAWLPFTISMITLMVFWCMYGIGARRISSPIERWLAFNVASLVTVLTMLIPLGGWVEESSAMHMIQHMLIMAVIMPLYMLARPLPQWVAVGGWPVVWLLKPLLYFSRYPMHTAFLQGVIIWFWHTPKFYNLALANPWWHLIEHICLVLGACVFWWSVLNRRTAVTLLALLFTLMHTGMLGALLTFAQIPLYNDSRDFNDQQLAGLIMWVPAGLPYLIAAIWCSLYWFRDTDGAVSFWRDS
ncbi:cytochrome c oxidase assembly protein [Nitrosomonas communis]|uniref:cytochrome c oxidase assembly protein n=1 Tax=Nitrosomonas communis TaxID=44574 RepID=UPI003D2AC325